MSDVEALAETGYAAIPIGLVTAIHDAICTVRAPHGQCDTPDADHTAYDAAATVLTSDWLAAYVAAERDRAVREALAPVRALATAQQSEGDRLIEKHRGGRSPASEKWTSEGYAMRRAATALRAALPDDREGEGA